MSFDSGKLLIVIGIVFIVAGLLVMFKIQIPWLGKLPGDVHIRRDNFQFYFPLTTCILLSILLTLVLRLFRK